MLHRLQRPFEMVYANPRGLAVQSRPALDASLQIEGAPSNNEPPALNPFHTAAISFSDRISRDRVYFRKELEDNRWKAGLYQTLFW